MKDHGHCQIILLSVLATFVDEITRILKVVMITFVHDDASIILACENIFSHSHGRDGHLKSWNCCEGRSEVVNSLTVPFLGFCQFCISPRGMLRCKLSFRPWLIHSI